MKRHLFLLVTVVTLIFSACGDKEEVKKDTENPTVSFLSPSATAEKLWNDIEISVDAKDGEGVSKVEFYIEGTLLETVDSSPYTIILNSRTYEDGKYAVKAVVFDNEGNEGEATREIEIFNKLLIVDMPLSYENDSQDWWVFISNNQGKILGAQQLVPGQQTIFERPVGFNDDSFNVSRFSSNNTSYSSSNLIHTYSSVMPRDWFFPPYKKEEFDDIMVNITGVTGEFFEYAYVSAHGIATYDDKTNQAKITGQRGNPLSMYFRFQNKHTLLCELEAGEIYNFDIANFKTPDNITISLPENEYFYAGVHGKFEEDYVQVDYASGEGTTTVANLSFVPNFFDDFKTFLILHTDKAVYLYNKKGEVPSSYNPPSFEISVEDSSRNNFTASSTGDFDVLIGRWYYTEGGNEDLKTLTWEAHRAAGEKNTMILPSLPEEIKTKYGLNESKTEYKSTRLVNYFSFDTYNQYLENLYNQESTSHFAESSGYEMASKKL